MILERAVTERTEFLALLPMRAVDIPLKILPDPFFIEFNNEDVEMVTL